MSNQKYIEELFKKTYIKIKDYIEKNLDIEVKETHNIKEVQNKIIRYLKVNSQINISGKINGSIVLSVGKEIAMSLSKKMFIEELNEIELTCYLGDVNSELLNQALGNAIEDLSDDFELNFYTANLILGDNIIVQYSESDVFCGQMEVEGKKLKLICVKNNEQN